MQSFTDFSLSIVPPPNPIRVLDNSLTDEQSHGREVYFGHATDLGFLTCNDCHVLDPEQGFFGSNGESSGEAERVSQNFKVPHQRNLYQKVGMFGGNANAEQIRGFGFLHNGSVDTLDNFFSQ